MKLIEYFDRTSIINLPERDDRRRLILKELEPFGADIRPERVCVPHAPRPKDPNGFDSRSIYGSYLSHLEIVKEALREGLETVWILEDDATFSHRMRREQGQIAEFLGTHDWDFCFFGHSLRRELAGMPRGFVPNNAPFVWMHCYAVRGRILPRLIDYLEENIANPPGHPRGGKMYIDAAYYFFRMLNPDVVSLVANPKMSIQRGSDSSIAGRYWYNRVNVSKPLVSMARSARDELWRRTDLHLARYPKTGRTISFEAVGPPIRRDPSGPGPAQELCEPTSSPSSDRPAVAADKD